MTSRKKTKDSEQNNGSHALVGKFFICKHLNGRSNSFYQGRVIRYLVNGFYLVDLYGWGTGFRTNGTVLPLEHFTGAQIFNDQDDWREAGKAIIEQTDARLSQESAHAKWCRQQAP